LSFPLAEGVQNEDVPYHPVEPSPPGEKEEDGDDDEANNNGKKTKKVVRYLDGNDL